MKPISSRFYYAMILIIAGWALSRCSDDKGPLIVTPPPAPPPCFCDTTPYLDLNCPCDKDTDTLPSHLCTCDTSDCIEFDCYCDRDTLCCCDTSTYLDPNCPCDHDTEPHPLCPCDTSDYLDPNCSCDTDTIPHPSSCPCDISEWMDPNCPCDPDTIPLVSYSNDIQPLWDHYCLDCHYEGADVIYLDAANSYTDLKAIGAIYPGFPYSSTIYTITLGPESDMPPGLISLTEEESALVFWWIKQGALNN
ncbi:MAG: hypothetical protein KKA81_14440 [Bacteroidetes bacterium]|nr:hypothetical protein [Bacteroidota bacterium]